MYAKVLLDSPEPQNDGFTDAAFSVVSEGIITATQQRHK